MKVTDKIMQHSTVITAFFSGAASALAAGYLYCRLVHRKSCTPDLTEVKNEI